MTIDSNTCKQCGGILRLEYVIGFEDGRPHDIQVKPDPMPTPFRLCFGHFDQPKHDGKLDKYNEVAYGDVYANLKLGWGYTRGILINGYDESISLEPKSALSLLAWLKQEETALEKLVEEQEAK